MTSFLLAFVVLVIFLIMLVLTKKIKYNKLLNPIVIFGPLLIVLWVICRIGVVTGYFFPSALQDQNGIILKYFTSGDYIGILGTVPELMWAGELLIALIVDFVFWGLIDKKRKMLIAAN